MMISTPGALALADFEGAVEAGKDAYCEKPMGNVLEEVKAARDAVKQRNLVVQIGTQHRSEPYQIAAREVRAQRRARGRQQVEIVWNYNGPRWRGRPEVKQIREQDTDWKKWLLTKPYRPFDPQLYFEFRLYKEFSSGIPDQWMSHGIDLVHFFMNEQPPRSVDGARRRLRLARRPRESRHLPGAGRIPVVPGQLLHQLRQRFATASPASWERRRPSSTSAARAARAGRWSRRRAITRTIPTIERAERWVTLPGDDKPGPINIGDEDLSHMSNWFECLRSRNTQTNATVDNGFLHSVAMHHGGAVVLAGQAAVLRREVRADHGLRACVRGDGLIARASPAADGDAAGRGSQRDPCLSWTTWL